MVRVELQGSTLRSRCEELLWLRHSVTSSRKCMPSASQRSSSRQRLGETMQVQTAPAMPLCDLANSASCALALTTTYLKKHKTCLISAFRLEMISNRMRAIKVKRHLPIPP